MPLSDSGIDCQPSPLQAPAQPPHVPGMSEPVNINTLIIEELYCEALVLSDEVREVFAVKKDAKKVFPDEDLVRVAMSCEGLGTTTRMMHAVAWLLNHRAHLMGELSEIQLRRYGRLSPDFKDANPDNLSLLPAHVRELIDVTDAFYARLQRLDQCWNRNTPEWPADLRMLNERLSGQIQLRGTGTDFR